MTKRNYSWILMSAIVLFGLSIALSGSVAAQSTGFVDIDADDLEGSGTADDPYIITNASELQAVEDDVLANYTLGNDIDATDTAIWNDESGLDPIDDLGGTFDGQGHTIESLTIDRPGEGNVGLFTEIGYRDQGGQVYNVTISNADVSGDYNVGILAGSNSEKSTISNVTISGTTTGNAGVGGVIGLNQGEIFNTSSDISITSGNEAGGIASSNQGLIKNASVSGSIDGDNSIGGVLGNNRGIIRQARSNAAIDGTDFVGGLIGYNYNTTVVSFASGSVTGSYTVGGLVGANSGNITNTYATGSINGNNRVGGLIGGSFNGGNVAKSFATGGVTGESNTGGAIGFTFNTTIENVYWDTETTGESTSAGDTVGLTTAEMTGSTAQSSMSALVFDTIWQTHPDDYPTLTSIDKLSAGGPSDSPTVDDVSYYADSDTGIVGPGGLGDAASNFRSGEIGPATLGEVAAAFRSGEPVV